VFKRQALPSLNCRLYEPEAGHNQLGAGSNLGIRLIVAYASVGDQHIDCIAEKAQRCRPQICSLPLL